MKKIALAAVLLMGLSFPANAANSVSHLKLSLWSYLAVAVPYNIYDVKGLDLGFGSTTDTLTGAQIDLIWAKTQYMKGASLSGIASVTRRHASGLQMAPVTVSRELKGAHVGAFNISTRRLTGAQVGFYNYADEVTGVQLGVINYAQYIRGVQVGLFNVAENGWLPAMIFVNGRF